MWLSIYIIGALITLVCMLLAATPKEWERFRWDAGVDDIQFYIATILLILFWPFTWVAGAIEYYRNKNASTK